MCQWSAQEKNVNNLYIFSIKINIQFYYNFLYPQIHVDTYSDLVKMKGELSLCHKLKFSNPYIFSTWQYKPLIFQTQIIWSNRIYSLKYLISTTLAGKDIVVNKLEFVTKTQFFEIFREIISYKINLQYKHKNALYKNPKEL